MSCLLREQLFTRLLSTIHCRCCTIFLNETIFFFSGGHHRQVSHLILLLHNWCGPLLLLLLLLLLAVWTHTWGMSEKTDACGNPCEKGCRICSSLNWVETYGVSCVDIMQWLTCSHTHRVTCTQTAISHRLWPPLTLGLMPEELQSSSDLTAQCSLLFPLTGLFIEHSSLHTMPYTLRDVPSDKGVGGCCVEAGGSCVKPVIQQKNNNKSNRV